MPSYDTLIKGGTVVDPGAGYGGRLDIAIDQGRIASVEADIDPAAAATVIDATDRIVTPGLVDLHTHIYWGSTYWGIEPDPVAARTGVTTWVDAGSAGAYSFPGFRRHVAMASRSRVRALLNLSSIGLIAPTWEFANPDYCDLELAATIVDGNRDLIFGVKARIDSNTTRGVGIRPLELARDLATDVGLPLMAHIGRCPPAIDEVAALLRPGDILTHCCTGQSMRIAGPNAGDMRIAEELRQRGVILDIGHGTGSFSYDSIEALMARGILPDVISTDIHQMSIQGPMFDMPWTLSKFLNLGMSLDEVIERATIRPARVLGLQGAGTLRPGSAADVAVFALERGDYVFQDVHMNERRGTQRLVNTLTMIDGTTLSRTSEPPLQPWAALPSDQQSRLKPLPGHEC